jgi:hypothetical protein
LTHNIKRPTGVTIISILVIISGVVLLFGGLSLIGAGALFYITSTDVSNNTSGFYPMAPFFGIAFLSIGSILLIIGIVYIIMSYGLLKGKGWAWSITIIVTIISIVIQIISGFTNSIITSTITNHANSIITSTLGPIIGIAINIIILYYLYRPHVKAFFGKPSNAVTTSN